MSEKPKLYAVNEEQKKYLEKLYPGVEVVLTHKLPITKKGVDHDI